MSPSLCLFSVSGLPKVSISIKPETPIYIGETVTLECVTDSRSDWSYTWFKGSPQTEAIPTDRQSKDGNILTIRDASELDQDEYWCQGERWKSNTSSLMSDPVYLTVSGELSVKNLSFLEVEYTDFVM